MIQYDFATSAIEICSKRINAKMRYWACEGCQPIADHRNTLYLTVDPFSYGSSNITEAGCAEALGKEQFRVDHFQWRFLLLRMLRFAELFCLWSETQRSTEKISDSAFRCWRGALESSSLWVFDGVRGPQYRPGPSHRLCPSNRVPAIDLMGVRYVLVQFHKQTV